MLLLTGLQDDYASDGRALVEALRSSALPPALRSSQFNFVVLANAYKQITAPLGKLGMTSLKASTRALAGSDATYAKIEGQISALTTQRDALAAQMIQALGDAEFNGKPVDTKTTVKLVTQAARLLNEAAELGNGD